MRCTWYDQSMDDKYNVRKSREPETKQESSPKAPTTPPANTNPGA